MRMRNRIIPLKNNNANRSVQNGTEWNGADWSRLHCTTEQFWNGRNGYFWLVDTHTYTHTHTYIHTYTQDNYNNPRCAHAHRGLMNKEVGMLLPKKSYA